MACEMRSAGALDYFPCRYGQSRLIFRGPWRVPQAMHAVALGGSLTYGRFVAEPWPQLLERATGRRVLNLGVPHAGPDAWLNEPDLLRLAAAAELRIVQLPGAVNLSNRYYTVHPRRNDRFLAASPALRRLYPEVDFTDFAFTRRMIRTLALKGADRFAEVAQVLAQAWLDRMGLLVAALRGPVALFWAGGRPPPLPGQRLRLYDDAPLLVDALMMRALRPHLVAMPEIVVPDWIGDDEGKVFSPLDAPAARALPGPDVHAAVAEALAPLVSRN